ncbi:hypothetical protein B0J14DRAFT_674837 [Halenospora varia]|nr:hypothetical protein B0J14DRAFT_674837 [Halenospora varia]
MVKYNGVAWIVGTGGFVPFHVHLYDTAKGCTRFALADVSSLALENTREAILDVVSADVLLIEADITSEEDVNRMAQQAAEKFSSFDYCANCAGVAVSPAPSHEMSPDDFRHIIQVNERGTWLCMRAQLRQIIAQNLPASIVNISSNFGFASEPGMVGFAAASHGIIGMSRSTALDYIKSGTRINVVCPGATESDFLKDEGFRKAYESSLPTARVNTPAEVANAVVFLLGPESSAIHGIVLPVDSIIINSTVIMFLTPLQPETIPAIGMVDFEEDPRTPTMNNINVADAYNWQHRANIAEQELSIERTKLQREKRKSRELQTQINEYIEALTHPTQDYSQTRSQCQFLPNTNLVLSRGWEAEVGGADFRRCDPSAMYHLLQAPPLFATFSFHAMLETVLHP